MRENDRAWAEYIEKTGLELNGESYEIEAQNLKLLTKREPRLLAKFDTRWQLPAPLRQNHYVLLPIKNGVYLLFQGDIFYSLPAPTSPQPFTPNLPFPLLTAGRGAGEMQYLDYAFNMGLLHHFAGLEGAILFLTIRGREYTGQFEFEIAGQRVQVDSVQIEVDAGYEGEREIILCETKIGHPADFNIRQLYYPFRHFSNLAPRKRVRTLFSTYDLPSLTHTFYEFVFDDPRQFNSLRAVKRQTYLIDTSSRKTVDALIDVHFETTSGIVPQADDFNRVLEIVNAVAMGYDTARTLADYFGLTRRQGDYYSEAAEFLGLLKREEGQLTLTDHGIALLSTSPVEQRERIAKLIVNSWLFAELIRRARQRGYFDGDDIESVIASVQQGERPRYSKSTVPRRRQTIEAWLCWLVNQVGCFAYEGGRYFLR